MITSIHGQSLQAFYLLNMENIYLISFLKTEFNVKLCMKTMIGRLLTKTFWPLDNL